MPERRVDFLYLDEPSMIKAGVNDMHRCVEVMTEMFVLLGKGDYLMGGPNGNAHGLMMNFPKTSPFPNMPLAGPDRRFMAMIAYLGGRFNVCGEKWYGSNRANIDKGLPRSILMIMLNDADTGAPLCLMSANLVSAMRTGAIPGVGAKYLARQGASVVGLVGAGVINRTSLMSLLDTCPSVDTVKVYDILPSAFTAIERFIRADYPTVKHIVSAPDLESLIRDSDIVSVATSGKDSPVIRGEWLKPGALLSLPASGKVDEAFCLTKARHVTDNFLMYEAWREEIEYPYSEQVDLYAINYLDWIHDGKLEKDRIDNLGDIIAGIKPGRRSDDEIILFSQGGMPVEDVAWSYTLYENALKQGLGISLNLWESPYLH